MNNKSGVGIVGAGHYLPKGIQTNEDICLLIPELTPEWIVQKTGIQRRYYATEDETASSMARAASLNAIQSANINIADIKLVIVASFSQDYLFPPMSAKIHSLLGLQKNCQILDLNTNCVGFVTALTIAAERMQNDESITNALVIGVELQSKFIDGGDKDTAIFFSDGAGAAILGKVKDGLGYQKAKFMTDSSTYESVRMRAGGSSYPTLKNMDQNKGNFIEQNGLATWKQAVTNLPIVINNLLKAENITISDVDFVIFHQANAFLIDYVMKKLKLPVEKTFLNVNEIGNTGSASIAIALSEAYEKDLIKPDQTLLIAGVGAGFNFGACIFKL